MDPQQTWADMLIALQRKEWDNARELADALCEWLRKGGFPPTTVGDESLGMPWHKSIAYFISLAVANKVDDVRKRRRRQSSTKEGA